AVVPHPRPLRPRTARGDLPGCVAWHPPALAARARKSRHLILARSDAFRRIHSTRRGRRGSPAPPPSDFRVVYVVTWLGAGSRASRSARAAAASGTPPAELSQAGRRRGPRGAISEPETALPRRNDWQIAGAALRRPGGKSLQLDLEPRSRLSQ